MRQKKFTLVELLVVIGIIMILAMIAFPAISSVRKKMQNTKAKSDIASITAALQQVQSTYSNFRNLISPASGSSFLANTSTGLVNTRHSGNITTKAMRDSGTNPSDAYVRLMREFIDPMHTATGAARTPQFNHRGIRMLDKRKHKDDTAPNSNGVTQYLGWLDPWGSEYVIYIDHDYNGEIEIQGGSGSNVTVTKPFFVYSIGPNMQDQNSRYSAVVANNEDDITLEN